MKHKKHKLYHDTYDSVPIDTYDLVNIIKEHDTISAGGLVQAVERNGKCILILGGTNPYSENSKNLVN